MLDGILYTQIIKPFVEQVSNVMLECPECGEPARYIKTVGNGNVIRCESHGLILTPFISE